MTPIEDFGYVLYTAIATGSDTVGELEDYFALEWQEILEQAEFEGIPLRATRDGINVKVRRAAQIFLSILEDPECTLNDLAGSVDKSPWKVRGYTNRDPVIARYLSEHGRVISRDYEFDVEQCKEAIQDAEWFGQRMYAAITEGVSTLANLSKVLGMPVDQVINAAAVSRVDLRVYKNGILRPIVNSKARMYEGERRGILDLEALCKFMGIMSGDTIFRNHKEDGTEIPKYKPWRNRPEIDNLIDLGLKQVEIVRELKERGITISKERVRQHILYSGQKSYWEDRVAERIRAGIQ